MTTIRYASGDSEFYGRFLVKFEVLRETDKTITYTDMVHLIGHFYHKRINKSEVQIFGTMEEAVDNLVFRINDRKERLWNSYMSQIQTLDRELEKLKLISREQK